MIVGHTDSSPNAGVSNIDKYSSLEKLSSEFTSVFAGSNADLGLLRAVSVQKLLQESIGNKYNDLEFRSYSASSLIDPPVSKNSKLDMEKRRIEIQLTRRSKESVINRC